MTQQPHRIAPSYAQCTWPIAACLDAAEQILGKGRQWTSANPTQGEFLSRHFVLCRNVNLDVVEAIASFSAKEIAEWLAERGFRATVRPYTQSQFGAASVLDILLRWIEGTAERHRLFIDSASYDAVKIERGVAIYRIAENHHPIVEVPTRDQRTRVYMTIIDSRPTGEFDLIDLAQRFRSARELTGERLSYYSGVIFPMIDFEERRSIQWIAHMFTEREGDGAPVAITEAWQINRLRMNEEGVRAQSAVCMTFQVLGGIPPQPYRIDKPFVLWIERNGLTEPLYAAWLDHDAWKDPGGLGLRLRH